MLAVFRRLAWAALAEWQRQADIKALEALTDHQLADLGLRREQIAMLGTNMREAEARSAVQAPMYRPVPAACG